MSVRSIAAEPHAVDGARAAAEASIPWYVWTSLIAVSSILFGGHWDISWHMSIGRDTFWTPAHLVIQFGGLLAGASCGYLILSTTLRAGPLRPSSIGVWGFRGPLGAFLAVWGAAAMVVSAPFDNWWHNAYGLDVKILSPPHAVLNLGILAVACGSLLLILSALNRSEGTERRPLTWIFLAVGGEILILCLTAVWEYTYRVFLHRSSSYLAISIVVPVLMLGVAHSSGRRWGATWVAVVYSVWQLMILWLFPLVPAQPKLGPVYQPITHLVPLEFPLLVLAPALVLDLLRARMVHRRRLSQALVLGPAFLLVFLAVEWPFATFLLSSASRNWLFGTHYAAYFQPPWSAAIRGVFLTQAPQHLALGLAGAFAAATMSAWMGLASGSALRRVRR